MRILKRCERPDCEKPHTGDGTHFIRSLAPIVTPTDTHIIDWLQDVGSPSGILFDPMGLFDDEWWYTKTSEGKRKYHKNLRAACWSVMAKGGK